MARPSLRVFQVSGGEQVEGERKKSDNLMKINKNIARLDKNPLRDHYRLKTFADLVKRFCQIQKLGIKLPTIETVKS